MAVVAAEHALAETQRAFDGVAATYDRSNTENPLLCAMRERARTELLWRVAPGSRILDLGCGPGTDDVPLAALGYAITAIDWSPAMVGEARRRIREADVADRVDVRHLGIHQLDRLAPACFDAAWSNFGPLNCVPDLAAAADAIARRLRPGAFLVATVIGRLCPWEIALYAGRGEWRRAAVRFSRAAVGVPLEGRTVWTQYYWPGELIRAFTAAGFAVVSRRALGLFAPPPYLQAFAAHRSRIVACLLRLDDLAGGWPIARSWGDHFIVVLRRT